MPKKIAIITHPLQYNYGGVLQAFALSSILSKYGEVCVIRNVKSIKDVVKYLLDWLVPFHRFKHRHIKEKFVSFNNLEDKLNCLDIDVVVIGSDQVWRASYAIENMTFGQFLSNDSSIRLIAYAASFGTNQWEFNDSQTKLLQNEIRKFSCISVREQSGVDLCSRYLNVKAQWVLDPTLLLDKKYYMKYVKNEKVHNKCFCYLLDYENSFNRSMMNQMAKELECEVDKVHLVKSKLLKRILPTLSIPGWLSKIYNARMVLTDSFHGCVFCIIFNKPFFVLENEKGGNDRIYSLLKMFRLENRIITGTVRENFFKGATDIDWQSVSRILTLEREKSMLFIDKALKDNRL